MSTNKNTTEQAAILEACSNGQSVWADAGAGCGKTYLADAASLTHAKAGKPVRQLVFMKALAESQKAKHANNVLVSPQTIHSFGYGMLVSAGIIRKVVQKTKNGKTYSANNVTTGDDKISQHVGKAIADAELGDEGVRLERPITDLVRLAKTEGVFLPSDHAPTMMDVAKKHGLLSDDIVPRLAEVALRASDADRTNIDQSDMIRLPVLLGFRSYVERGSLVVVDECQDYNLAMALLLTECIAPKGTQVLLVGDKDHQSLMQFTGARPELTDVMAEHYGCVRMPLTVNFRCSKAVLRNACGRPLQPRPDAPEGEVGTVQMNSFMRDIEAGTIGEGAAVLSEANLPLIVLGLRLLANGIPVQMRADKLEGQVRRFCYRYIPGAFDTRKTKIGQLSDKIRQAMNAVEREGGEIPEDDKEMLKALDSLETYCLSQGILESRYNVGTRSFEHPIQIALHKLLTGTKGVTLCTGHTSKGLEWETVYHLPAKVKTPELDWQVHQAFCLMHVIQTRAKLAFYTVID
jgi:hypothetical protein